MSWEEPLKANWSNSLAVNRDNDSYISLLTALSSLTLSISRDTASITSGQPVPVLHHSYCKKKNFLFRSCLNLFSSSLKPYPLALL